LRWVFPHAPVRAVTLNGGMRMRAWYDILGLNRRAAQDEAGIPEASKTAPPPLPPEAGGGGRPPPLLPPALSQGGAIALFAGLRYPERLAGILALSTYLPLDATLAAEAHPAGAAVPVFQAHGRFDEIVPLALGQGTRDLLVARGYDVDWRTY